VEKAPGHCADLVEEAERGVGAPSIDRSGNEEEAQVSIDFLGAAVGDAPVVRPVLPGSSLAFGESPSTTRLF